MFDRSGPFQTRWNRLTHLKTITERSPQSDCGRPMQKWGADFNSHKLTSNSMTNKSPTNCHHARTVNTFHPIEPSGNYSDSVYKNVAHQKASTAIAQQGFRVPAQLLSSSPACRLRITLVKIGWLSSSSGPNKPISQSNAAANAANIPIEKLKRIAWKQPASAGWLN